MRTFTYLTAALFVVALVVTAIGVSTYEDDRVVEFFVTWTSGDESVTASGTQTGAGTTQLTFTLLTANLTGLEATVTITVGGSRVQATTVSGALVGPDGVEYSTDTGNIPQGTAAATVELAFTATLATIPTRETVQARDPDSAASEVARDNSTTLGQGAWNVTLEFGSTGALEQLQPPNYSLALSGTARHYSANVTRDLPDINR